MIIMYLMLLNLTACTFRFNSYLLTHLLYNFLMLDLSIFKNVIIECCNFPIGYLDMVYLCSSSLFHQSHLFILYIYHTVLI